MQAPANTLTHVEITNFFELHISPYAFRIDIVQCACDMHVYYTRDFHCRHHCLSVDFQCRRRILTDWLHVSIVRNSQNVSMYFLFQFLLQHSTKRNSRYVFRVLNENEDENRKTTKKSSRIAMHPHRLHQQQHR